VHCGTTYLLLNYLLWNHLLRNHLLRTYPLRTYASACSHSLNKSVTASGRSIVHMWPPPGTTRTSARGISAAIASCWLTGLQLSASPQQSQVRWVILGRYSR